MKLKCRAIVYGADAGYAGRSIFVSHTEEAKAPAAELNPKIKLVSSTGVFALLRTRDLRCVEDRTAVLIS